MAAASALCRAMCDTPRLPRNPVYGSNNWYYAYGANVSAPTTLRDAELMAELSPAAENRPFVVIDMGWGEAPDGAGPVSRLHKGFSDMPELAAAMKRLSVRPGIWTRPLLTYEHSAEATRELAD
jgi:alpha-galactosidase